MFLTLAIKSLVREGEKEKLKQLTERKTKGRVDPAFSFQQKSVVLGSEGTSAGLPFEDRPVNEVTL